MPITELAHAGPGGGTLVLNVLGVSSGADIIVVLAQTSTGTRTYTVSSNVGGAFTQVVAYNPRGYVGVFRLKGAAAGDHTITIAATTNNSNVWGWAFEATGLDQSVDALVPTGGGYTDPAVTDNHFSAPDGELVISDTGVAVCAGVISASIGTTTAGTGWTKATAASTAQAFCQFREIAASTNRGDWVSGATDRVAESTMAVFLDASEGGGGPTSTWGLSSGFWVGL